MGDLAMDAVVEDGIAMDDDVAEDGARGEGESSKSSDSEAGEWNRQPTTARMTAHNGAQTWWVPLIW